MTSLPEDDLSGAQLQRQMELIRRQNIALEEQKRALTESNARLEALVSLDGLTGVKNHRAFQDRFREEFDQSLRRQTPLSIVMLDIDRFKQFNDAYGHPAGDTLLSLAAQILEEEARPEDMVARYGGEEFVILLPATDAEEALLIAERLRARIEQAAWTERSVTASFGVATRLPEHRNPSALISDADKALYQSKRSGRNQVTHIRSLEDWEAMDQDTREYLEGVTLELLALRSDDLDTAVERIREMLLHSYDVTVESWAAILDMRDKETERHSRRVANMTARLARFVGMNEEEVLYVRWGALLHDVGKISIPDAILQKTGPLTVEEWRIMRQHPTTAYNMLSAIPFLRASLDIPYCHHERWDGSGYPRGLKEEEIPIPARLFTVVDVYDALCSPRPYRKGWSERRARQYLNEQAGLQFDPRSVRIFLKMLSELKREERTDAAGDKAA